jgi:hypothetical protein
VQKRGVLCVSKKKDECYKITFHFICSDDIMPTEIHLVENQLGELLKQVIREADQETKA